VTVSAQSLSLFRRLSSRFGIDSLRFLDYTARGKRGRGRGSCASVHGAGSSGEIKVKVLPAVPADTWASAATRWCRRLVARSASAMAEARRTRLTNSRSCSSLLAAIAARRCGATSLALRGQYDGDGLQGGRETVDRGGPGPSTFDGVGNKPARMSWPSAAAAASADREHQHARTQSYNRLVNTVKRTGYGFRNRENSACRIRFQSTRKRRPEPKPQPDCPGQNRRA
jgi:hypothetical protein